jgi:hypothetical protein
MFDPRHQQQRPQMQGGGGGWGQNNPWLQQLAQQAQARQQQGGMRGPAVGAGMPGPGGVPFAMPQGPGLQPQPGAAPQGPPGGGFGQNPAFLQQLAQRVPQQGAPGSPGYPQPSFQMPQQVTPGHTPDSDSDDQGKRY